MRFKCYKIQVKINKNEIRKYKAKHTTVICEKPTILVRRFQ